MKNIGIAIIVSCALLGLFYYATATSVAEHERALACENQGRIYGMQRNGMAVFYACSPTPTGKE